MAPPQRASKNAHKKAGPFVTSDDGNKGSNGKGRNDNNQSNSKDMGNNRGRNKIQGNNKA